MSFLDFHDKNGLGKMFRSTCYPIDKPEKWPDVLGKLSWAVEGDGSSKNYQVTF